MKFDLNVNSAFDLPWLMVVAVLIGFAWNLGAWVVARVFK